MEFFHYKVKDQKGQELEGTISSVDQQKAIEALQARGFKVVDIVSRTQLATGQPIINQPAAKIDMPPMPTYGLYQYKGSDKERYFILGQMSELLRAGVNPVQGFTNLGLNQRNAGFRKSLEEMSTTSASGGMISDVMRKYPRLYPEHVIGMTRAGEYGGFLPEALEVASKQAKDAHVFKIWFWFIWAVVINLFTSIPATMVVMDAWRSTFWKTMDAGSGTSEGVIRDIISKSFQNLFGLIGGISFLIFLASLGAYLYYMQPKCKKLRHGLAIKYRLTKKRAYSECASLFAWSISRLSRAGVPPNSAWSLSCDCVPNLVLRDRLVKAGSMMSEGSQISESLRQTKVLPDEFASYAATGELTGTIPGTFERLHVHAQSEFDGHTNRSKYHSCCLGCLWFGITYLIGTVLFFYYYGDLLNGLFKDING